MGSLAGCADAAHGPATSSGAVDLQMWTHDPGYVKTFTESAAELSTTSPFRYDVQVTRSAARVGAGRLVVCTLTLDDSPAAVVFRGSSSTYLAGDAFAPEVELTPAEVRALLAPA